MKKISLVLLMVFITFTTIARHDKDSKLYKGVRVGYQSSNLFDGSTSLHDNLSSFYVGFFGVKKLGAGKLLSLYSGLTFYQTGSKKNDDNQVVLGYISIPVSLRVKIGPAYAFGGFNAAFKVGEKVEDASLKIAGIDAADFYDINGFDAGAQIGIGAKIAFIGAELKYNWGLIDISGGEGNSINTQHFQAGLNFYF